MEKYIEQVERYKEIAVNEPEDLTDYVEGLDIALYLGQEAGNKQELVDMLTDRILNLLPNISTTGLVVRGLVSSLKEAVKLEGDLDLKQYHVVTPVDMLVKDSSNNVMPKKFVNGSYDAVWTMPEILTNDITYVQFIEEL